MTEHEPPPLVLVHETLSSEPPTRRIRQYGLMMGFAVLAVVFTVWLIWSYAGQHREAKQNAAAATKLCRQLNNVGQPCATQPAGDVAGVSGDAQLPAPTASLGGVPLAPSGRSPTDPLPTDEDGIPQAYQPSEGALIVSVNVQEGRLILTFDDGARLDAGAVNEQTLAIVLKSVPSPSPSPSPSPVLRPAAGESTTPSPAASPEVSPEESPS